MMGAPSAPEASIRDAQRSAIDAIAGPGDWLTGEQRLEAWRHARNAESNELDRRRRQALSPNAVADAHAATELLSAAAIDVVHRLASDPGRLTRAWADPLIEALGEETYTELVGVVATTSVIDRFHDALGEERPALPPVRHGEPTRQRPDGMGDVGAWVSQATGSTVANVSRTLSLVPGTNASWRELVTTHYSRGAEFMDAVWSRPLTRPQVELVASRTTTWNECFY
jgi:hypothetical protein